MSTFGIKYRVVNTNTNCPTVVREINEKYKAVKHLFMAECRNSKDAEKIVDALNFCHENKQLFKEILADLESGMFCNPDKETLNKIQELLNNATV